MVNMVRNKDNVNEEDKDYEKGKWLLKIIEMLEKFR